MRSPDNPFLADYFKKYQPVLNNGDNQSVLFLIGSTSIGGGTYVILQHAQYLSDQGYDVTIAARMVDHAMSWHPGLDSLPIIDLDEASTKTYDLCLATWWVTVYDLPRISAGSYAYLVQSIEGRFSLGGPEEKWAPALAELTYRFGLPVITIAQYLSLYLGLEHQLPSYLVRNGIRKDYYNPVGPSEAPRPEGKLRVLVEGPLDVPMKNVEASLRLARAGGASEVWLVTTSDVSSVAGADRVFSRLSASEMGAVYRSCDVLLKLSLVEGMFGPPLEMFHCGGTAVTYDVTGHEEYLQDGVNSRVLPTGDEDGVIAAIRDLARRPEELARLKSNALRTADRWATWDESSREFARVIGVLIGNRPPDPLDMILKAMGGKREFERIVSG